MKRVIFQTYLSFTYTIFSLCIAFVSCEIKNEKKEQTTELRTYLKEQNIPFGDSLIYLLFPANQCKNCFLFDGNKIDPCLNNRLVVVSGFPPKRIINFKNFHYDSSNVMMSLKLLDYGSKLISIQEGRIKNISSLDVYRFMEQMDSLAKGITHLNYRHWLW